MNIKQKNCVLCGIYFIPEDKDDKYCQCCKDDMEDCNPYGYGSERGYGSE